MKFNQLKCCVCNKKGERHHIKTRASGGPDDDFNILILCRLCHIHFHQYGASKFFKKYPAALVIVTEKGWYFLKNKLFNDKLLKKS